MPITAWMDGLAPASPGPATGQQFDNRRVFAALIDIALLVPVALLMATLFGGFTGPAAALTLGWALYYYFAFESDHGQTIGKRVMKIRVVRADGRPLDTGRAAVRTLLRPIDGIGAYLVGLVVMLATGQRRQRLGDLAAGTVVTDAGARAVADEPKVEAAEAPVVEAAEAPVVEPPVIDAPPPNAEDRVPDEPFAEPEPVAEPEPEPEPLVEPEPEPEPEPQAAPQDIVPVDRPEEPEPPTEEPVPVEQADPPLRADIVAPIDLVMQDPDEDPKPRQA